jgi:hypothetical protein
MGVKSSGNGMGEGDSDEDGDGGEGVGCVGASTRRGSDRSRKEQGQAVSSSTLGLNRNE